MSEHHASRVVSCDATTLYTELSDVQLWPEFLEGLEAVEPLGHHRYRWTVCFAGRTRPREVDVVLSLDPRTHRVSWRHLTRPAFDGSFRLEPVSESRTRVHLDLAPTPEGSLEGLYDVARMDHWDAGRDLERLADVLAARRGDPGIVAEQEASG